MKKNKLFFNILFLLVALPHLYACSQMAVQSENNTTEQDNSSESLLVLSQEAETAYLNNDLNKSAEAYEILVEKIPQEATYWFRLANIYVKTNRPQEAIELYREALIRDPKFSKAWYNLSIVQLKQTAYNLNEMLIYTDPNDPLYEKGIVILEKVEDIIKQD